MAEDSTDQSQKTEEPTQKKLDEARRKGQVANSREVNHAFMIVGAAIIVMTFGTSMVRDVTAALARFIGQAHTVSMDTVSLRDYIGAALGDLGYALIMPFAVLVAAALFGGLIQNGLVIAPERIRPSLQKISLFSGFKRLFSLKSVAEFVKGLFKIAIVGTVATMLVLPELSRLEQMTSFEAVQLLDTLQRLTLRVLIGVAAIVALIAALDYLYQNFEHLKSMRMSRQEIKDELKQSEGDPMVKARLRQVRQERARRRMMAAVPEASVVITNPTHFAVALKYEHEEMHAPVMVAKGIDSLALNIRRIAEDHGVPVIENPPLARALHAGVEIDEEIPEEHYRAVAEIIGYVMKLKGRLKTPRA